VAPMLVTVEGAEADVSALTEIAGYRPSIHSARPVGDGRWAVDAEIEAAIVPQIEAAGCVVTIVLDEAAMAAHEAQVRDDIESPPPIA
jgi:hypothetical protein